MKRFLSMLIILAMVLSLSACIPSIKTEDGEISFKDGKIQITSEDGTATLSEEGMTIEDEDGNSTFTTSEDGVKLSKGFPTKTVPIIDDSIIIVSSNQTVNEVTEYWVTLQCKKDVEEAMEFYKDVMKSAGDKQVVESSEMSFITGVKDGMEISITMFPEENDEYKSMVSMSVKVTQ